MVSITRTSSRTSTRTAARTTAALIGFGLVFTTVGCANPIDQLVNSVTEGAVKEMTGLEDVSLPTDGSGSAKLPSTWPDIPTPSQAPDATFTTAEGQFASFQLSADELESLKAEFEGASWQPENEFNMSDQMQSVTFVKGDLSVTVSAIDDDSGSLRVQYLVVTPGSSTE